MNVYALDFVEIIKERDFDGLKALVVSKLPLVAACLIVLIIGFFLSNIIGKLTVKGLEKKRVDPSTHGFIHTIVVLFIRIIFILSALSTLGLNINSFVAAIAAGGVTIGLGLQSSVSQIASGIEILMNRPFRSGDFIELSNVSGKVKEIKLMYTVLITLDNKRAIIPNSTVTTSSIINYTAEKLRRIDLVYSISYDADIEKAKSALKKVADGCELIADRPEPIIAVCEHSASSINLACQVYCNPGDYFPVFYYMQENVKLEFDKQGIKIPYTQTDVHVYQE